MLDCLSSVLKQDYQPIEVIAIDDASTDKTYDLLSSFKANKALKVIRHERNMGLAATYNHGLEISRGAFVLLLHQDCRLGSADWLSRALKHFADTKVAVVTGQTLLNLENMNFNQKAFTFLRKIIPAKNKGSSIEFTSFSEGKCDLCRKEILTAVGGFPSHKLRISGEDQWVSYAIRRKGYKIVRDTSLTFRQEITGDLYNNLKKEFIFGKTQAGISLKYGLFQLKDLDESPQMRGHAINRVSKLAVAFLISSFLVAGLILSVPELMILSVLMLATRILFFVATSLRCVIRFTLTTSLATSILGIITDFIYFSGFILGLFLSIFGRKL